MEKFGDKLKQYRTDKGLTRAQVYNRTYISDSVLEKYENNRTTPPPNAVLTLSRAYNEPSLPRNYCRNCCAIGNYIFTNIDESDDLQTAALKLTDSLDITYNNHKKMRKIIIHNTKDDYVRTENLESFEDVAEILLTLGSCIDNFIVLVEKRGIDIRKVIKKINKAKDSIGQFEAYIYLYTQSFKGGEIHESKNALSRNRRRYGSIQ